MNAHQNIALAICEVMAAASHVQKTGQNSFHGYAYASDADLLRVLQPAMAKAGLAMVPAQIAIANKQLDKGKVQTDVHVQYTLVHSSGETLHLQAVGRGIDKEDKGPYKAMTGALKYALRQTFLVPTGDDPEVHSAIHAEPEPAPKKPVAKKPVAKKPAPKKAAPKKAGPVPECPDCGGEMWDNSAKRIAGGRAPAYKCKRGTYSNGKAEGCQGIIWDVVGAGPKNVSVAAALDDDEIPF
jgi:hypothetical protein